MPIASTLHYSADSLLLARASTTSVQILDAKKNRLLMTIPIPIETQTTVRFLTDGKTLAILSRRTGLSLHRYTFENGVFHLTASNCTEQLKGYALGSPPSPISSLWCLISKNKGIVWDSSSEQTLCTIQDDYIGQVPSLKDLILSPDKKHLVSTHRTHPARLWAFPSGEMITEFPDGRSGSIAFSPSGRWLGNSVKSGNNILREVKTWTRGPSLPLEVEKDPGHFAFSPDEKFFASRMNEKGGAIAFVSLPAGELLAILDQRILPHRYGVLCFSPDGTQLASQCNRNSLVIWNLPELHDELRKLNLQW